MALIRTWYLEMTRPPEPPSRPGPSRLDVRRLAPIDPGTYRRLHREIGADCRWWSRLTLPEDRLRALLADPGVEVHLATAAGEEAGYFELHRRPDRQVEISFLGLHPAWRGQGLGRELLDLALARAWTGETARVWLHTCAADHPSALPLYREAGLRICRETQEPEPEAPVES